MNETAICTIGNQRKQLTEKMNLQLIHSIMKEVLETKEGLLSKKDFWESHQCRKISYDLLNDTFTPGPTFNIDTELRKVLLAGFYALFPEYPKSNKDLDKHKAKKKERLLACWRYLFLNSIWAMRDHKRAISLSMNKNHYAENSGKYYSGFWGYAELREVTESAICIGYYKKFPGRQRGEEKKSYITRLELLDGFYNLLENHVEQNKTSKKGSLPEDFTVDDLVMSAIIPRQEKQLLVVKLDKDDYKYNDYPGGIKIPSISSSYTRNIYNNVKNYNEYMNKQQILISVNIDSISQNYLNILYQSIFRGELSILNKDQLLKSDRETISINLLRKIYRNYKEEERERDSTHQLYPYINDVLLNNNNIIPAPSNCNGKLIFALCKFHSYRSYNSNLMGGGRFYGLVHQQLSKEIRLDTMINGQPVVELDYKALHPSLLYSSIGKQPPENIYIFEDKEDVPLRRLVKIIALVMFNAEIEWKAFAAIRKEFHDEYELWLEDEDIKPAIELFFEENPDLRQFYLKGLGRKLQNQDSNIMARILTNLRKQAIPAIPVHDSVIVPATAAYQVQETMVEAYQHITKTSHVPFITTKAPQGTM